MNRRIQVCVGRATTLMVVLSLGLAGAFATPAGASDKSAAKKLVLTKADVGSGYTSSKGGDSAAPAQDPWAQIFECLGQPVSDRVVTAQVTGPLFTAETEATETAIGSQVQVVKTKAMVAAAVAALSDPKFESCAAPVFTTQFGPQATRAGQPRTQTVPVKRYGSFSKALQVSFLLNSSFGARPVTQIIVFIQKGRALINVAYLVVAQSPVGDPLSGLPAPFDPTKVDALLDPTKVEAVLDKLKPRLKDAPK